jgi:hypothetical protein
MAAKKRPRFQQQGPDWRCKINGKMLGWVSCTAYSMAMGIDSSTNGAKRPKGCEVRRHTNDFVKGLTLSQVANVATENYGVRVTVRTGNHTIAPDKAWEQASLGRGFVLQGNCEALVHTRFRSTKGPVNHAVWVNRVRGGTAGHPREAKVFDPAADGRHAPWGTADKGPTWWPWETVVAFAAALRGDAGKRIGPGRMYAGFVPKPAAAPSPQSGLKLFPGAKKTTPFPDRTRANPPEGHRVNVRSDPRSLDPGKIVDRLSDGALYVAYQRFDGGARPGGASPTWYGNEDGTEWIHETGLRHIGEASMGPAGVIGVDLGDEDVVIGAELLQADIFEDNFAPDEFTYIQLSVDPDAPVPEEGNDVEGDDEADAVDEALGWGGVST